MSDTPTPPNASDGGDDERISVEPIQLQDEMERSFLDYAMSVIMARALPDVRDGLKPVHRRIIWDMEEQGFRPNRPHVKSARVTGDTMAKFHPHGDSAIYDALVRMAQPFSLRHPLIDFHGNYGSPDFGAAASRYTECRLDPLAMHLLADIDEDTVEMVRNYDDTRDEPTVLPSRFPNLLVNGSQGIAVGMATNIPPHNLGEVIDATIHLIDHPEATPDDLMQFVKGPDFPTGGYILGRAGMMDAYRTGRGSIKMRAKASIEETKRGGFQIVVTELPYQTSCSPIARRIQELVDTGELDGIADVNDGSAGGKTSLVISLKRDANANVVLNNLFKLTQLQTSFGVNMVALVEGVPRTLNLVDALAGYVRHQVDVITRRTEHRLSEAKRRLHIYEGRFKALNVIDAIIALIRASDDQTTARAGLMAAPFEFTELQANDILEMRLGQLTRLSRIDIETEIASLKVSINEPQGILNIITPTVQLPVWAAGPSLALVVIMIYGVWTFFGFNTVIFLAGLGNIPKEMYEAASIDGAGRWPQFRHITLPLLSPTIYFLTLYSVIGTFKAFNHIYVLRTGAALGTTDTASVVIFQTFQRDTRYGYASALAILLLLVIIMLTVVNNRIAARRVHYG